ncbi:hypothetical protein PM082_024175 [Marasmius tenuissimus]|nr:hypothetical protein PM082_024175 [Marasmius tenuissimus]
MIPAGAWERDFTRDDGSTGSRNRILTARGEPQKRASPGSLYFYSFIGAIFILLLVSIIVVLHLTRRRRIQQEWLTRMALEHDFDRTRPQLWEAHLKEGTMGEISWSNLQPVSAFFKINPGKTGMADRPHLHIQRQDAHYSRTTTGPPPRHSIVSVSTSLSSRVSADSQVALSIVDSNVSGMMSVLIAMPSKNVDEYTLKRPQLEFGTTGVEVVS